MSDPKSAINPRKPKTTKIGEAKSRKPRKKRSRCCGYVRVPEPNSPVSTPINEPINEPQTTTTRTPRKSRSSASPVAIPELEIAPNVKKGAVPKPRPQGSQRAGKKSAVPRVPPLVYATRLLILGVGIAVICGTLLSVANAVNRSTVAKQETPAQEKNSADSAVAARWLQKPCN